MITIIETNGKVEISPDINLTGTLKIVGPLKILGSGTIHGNGEHSKIEGENKHSSLELFGKGWTMTFEEGYYKDAHIIVG
jgi:hypothetical protein